MLIKHVFCIQIVLSLILWNNFNWVLYCLFLTSIRFELFQRNLKPHRFWNSSVSDYRSEFLCISQFCLLHSSHARLVFAQYAHYCILVHMLISLYGILLSLNKTKNRREFKTQKYDSERTENLLRRIASWQLKYEWW